MTDAVHLPYRPCVGIAVFNRHGHVFVGQRVGGNELLAPCDIWQMPQGGIDRGEAPLDAALRELWEETSIKTVSLLAEAPEWIYYDLPVHLVGKAWKGRYRGQKQRWFAFRFEGDETQINISSPGDGHKPEFQKWSWMPLASLPAQVVPFKRAAYEQVVGHFNSLAVAL